jgi:predicted acylesterase/phospholipase RssA
MLENTVAERTKHQQNIIRNYYENRETISLQRAQEIITELYLSEGKKRQKYWKSLEGHLQKLEVKQQVIDNLISKDDPQIAAQFIQKLGKKLDAG